MPALTAPGMAVIEVLLNGEWITLNDADAMIVIRANGRDVCAVDQYYAHRHDDRGVDPWEPDEPPHLIVGHWASELPDEPYGGEDWERDVVYPIDAIT